MYPFRGRVVERVAFCQFRLLQSYSRNKSYLQRHQAEQNDHQLNLHLQWLVTKSSLFGGLPSKILGFRFIL